ncbi:hypothetical protein J4467_00740 [Candidatus Woesearchaeota archaeon]|nr:hypothetical protein [Candidatus Woesearchaeota archaeon]
MEEESRKNGREADRYYVGTSGKRGLLLAKNQSYFNASCILREEGSSLKEVYSELKAKWKEACEAKSRYYLNPELSSLREAEGSGFFSAMVELERINPELKRS